MLFKINKKYNCSREYYAEIAKARTVQQSTVQQQSIQLAFKGVG